MRRAEVSLGIGEKVEVALADTFLLRLRGLLGRDVRQIGGLLITPCNQIHTCFMAYPIDVVYLGADGEVIKVDRTVQPWRFCPVVPEARSVLEFPANCDLDLAEAVACQSRKTRDSKSQ